VTNDLPRKRPVGAPQRQWRRPVPEDHINHYPPLIAGAIAAGVAVVIGYILTLGFIMAAWLFAAHGSESTVQVLRAAGIAWQVMHLVPLVIGTTTIGVLPWGFLVVPVLILWKATQWALKSSQPKTAIEFIRIAISISLIYSGLAGLIGLICSTNDLYTGITSSILHTLFVALAVTSVCIITYAPSRTILTDAMPKLIVDGIRPMLGGGVVNPENASPGALPAFPLLSILPSESAALAAYFVLVPILIGIAIYFLIPRERWSAQGDSIAIALSFVVRWREVVTLLVSVGLLSIFVWIAAAASSGSLGIGYLKFVGPVPTEVAAAAIAVCGLSALLTLVIPRTVMSLLHCWFNREAITK